MQIHMHVQYKSTRTHALFYGSEHTQTHTSSSTHAICSIKQAWLRGVLRGTVDRWGFSAEMQSSLPLPLSLYLHSTPLLPQPAHLPFFITPYSIIVLPSNGFMFCLLMSLLLLSWHPFTLIFYLSRNCTTPHSLCCSRCVIKHSLQG